jgi:hypothetical protein
VVEPSAAVASGTSSASIIVPESASDTERTKSSTPPKTVHFQPEFTLRAVN